MPIPRWAERPPDALGLITADRAWTCAEIRSVVAERVRAWRGAGSVGVVGGTTLEHLFDLLAAIDAGVPAVLLHPRWTERERDAVLERARPPLVSDAGRLRRRADASALPPHVLAVVATSGTTGVPKLAVLSRRALETSAIASAAHLGASADDRWLLAMPLAHVGGLGVVIRSLVYRAPIVLAEDAEWYALARDARVTHVSLVPTLLARLLDAAVPLPALRVVLVGGAACPAPLLDRALAAGLPARPTYGLTETCGQVATATSDRRALVPLPGVDVRVVDGSLRVRSPAAMDGWLDAPSPFDADGYYDTGDLGMLDADGHVVIDARRTDLVVTGGENVYPREVEDVLERMPGVRAACVFGVADPEWGERVAAAVVVERDGPSDAELVARARCELAGFKVPRSIARVSALAVGANGKIDRAETKKGAQDLLRAL